MSNGDRYLLVTLTFLVLCWVNLAADDFVLSLIFFVFAIFFKWQQVQHDKRGE